MLKRKGQMLEESVYSSFLQEDVPLIIYLPENYSPLYSYPTVYVQDGYDYFTLGKMASQLEKLIDSGKIERCIAVGIPVSDQGERFRRYSTEGTRHLAYTRFFGEELIPFIDHTYATLPVGGARAVMGESLGGAVSLMIGLTYPHTFHYVVSQSGAFYHGVEEAIAGFSLAPSLLSIYLSVGEQETNVQTSRGEQNLLQLNRQIKQQLEHKGFPLYYREFEGDHTWAYWQNDLLHALTYIWGK